MPTVRPSVFVGSSSEGLKIAEAIQVGLDRACEVVLWSQGVFGLATGTLEALVEKSQNFDFAILVLTPDDMASSRGVEKAQPRDNVLIELGLFIGVLGRARTFIVYDHAAGIKLPTDLAGVTHASFQSHKDGNLVASLGAACTEIKTAIEKLGNRVRTRPDFDVDQNTQFQIIADLLDEAAKQFLILMDEKNLSLRRESIFGPGIRYQYQQRKMRQLAGNGFFSVDKLCDSLPDAGLLQIDLRAMVSLTARGKSFAEWLVKRGYKADDFKSDFGEWGNSDPRGWPPQGWPLVPAEVPKG